MQNLRLLPVPAFSDNYIWLLADPAGRTVIVDPGEAAPVRAALQRERLQATAILLTHHHPDHIGGVAELLRDFDVPVYAPDDERIEHVTHRIGDGDQVILAAPAIEFEVIAVPGHTRSHIAFFGGGTLFCGDTLFSLGCGRLFEGTPQQMLESLQRLAALPGNTQVCCGHEYTLANATFALEVEPDNETLRRHLQEVRRLRSAQLPTLPSTLALETAANPFLRSDTPALAAFIDRHLGASDGGDAAARFGWLRAQKDAYRMPAA